MACTEGEGNHHAFNAFTGDVICKICCDDKEVFLDGPSFASWWFDIIRYMATAIPLLTAFPILVSIASNSCKYPPLGASSAPEAYEAKTIATKHITNVKQEELENDKKGTQASDSISLFKHIVNSDMPESERSIERLTKEAQVLLLAGTESVARTLSYISYFILSNPSLRFRLEKELETPMSRYPEVIPTWVELEKVPILQAIIKESLRHSYGSMHRLPRCSPDVPIQYKQWTIPAGAPVGMSSYFMHTDPLVYENPFEFNPERWLGGVDPVMNRNWVPFSRGSRNCLGQNLAYAEMYLTLALLFRPNGPKLELFETDESDVLAPSWLPRNTTEAGY
ncbi:MAG: hypothetical protein LQ342_003975 [Letrouitia transgressa]|nr:MAG: hypothetical protein LQ342_003975 [Letrouitia transgressa]